jgi:hypothetical protein
MTIPPNTVTTPRQLALSVHVGQQNAGMDELVDLWRRLDDAVEQIAAFRAAGADMVNVALRLPVDADALDAYLDVVVPAARIALS